MKKRQISEKAKANIRAGVRARQTRLRSEAERDFMKHVRLAATSFKAYLGHMVKEARELI